jgi:hypothetical protein
MNAYDPMEITSSPLPSTPPELDDIPELSPTQYKSEAIVISSDSESESEGWKKPPNLATNQQQQQQQQHHDFLLENNNNNQNPTPTRNHNNNDNSSAHQTMSVQSSVAQALKNMSWYEYTILDHATTSPPAPNPPITVLLALTPQPGTIADQAAFEDFGARFSEDFSNVCVEETWGVVSLYAHYREWARRSSECEVPPDESPVPGAWPVEDSGVVTAEPTTTAGPTSPPQCDTTTDDEKEIGNIHPFALLAKLEQETDVHWRFFIPVLQHLIDRKVKEGTRQIIVGGFKIGDLAGIRAFAQKVSIPLPMPVSRRPVQIVLTQKSFSTDHRTSRHARLPARRRPIRIQLCHRTQ